MIRNENVSVFIGTTQIYPLSLIVTLGIDKGYNTCSISGIRLSGNVGDEITVHINADTYVFVLTNKVYNNDDKVTLNGKGKPFILENQSSSDEVLDYPDSDTLIENERGSIDVTNNIPNITFGIQSYSKNATPMSRISDMVAVIGGEKYEVNSTLILDEIKSIPQSPDIAHEFLDSEIFSYSYSDTINQSVVVKQVLINPISEDIYSQPSITCEYDETSSIASVYFNPSLSSGDSYSFLGLAPTPPINTTKVEKILVSAETQVHTIGGIDSVVYINLDGEPFTDYVIYPTENVIRFTGVVTGEIEVKYNTKYIKSYVSASTNFVIKYNCVKCSGTITIDNKSSVNTGTCKVYINSPLTYEDGGSVVCYADTDVTLVFIENVGDTNIETVSSGTHDGGGALTVKYTYTTDLWDDTSFMNNITSEKSTQIETTSGVIEYNEALGVYLVYIPTRITGINSILNGDVGITDYTYVDDEKTPYITFKEDDAGKYVDISMNVDEVVITIPAPTIDSVVTKLDAAGCGGVATQDFTNNSNVLCSIPATFKIDVAEQLNLPISEISGKTITGDKGIGDKTIDKFGKIKVTISAAELYTIDCSSIKDNARIIIDATGVE